MLVLSRKNSESIIIDDKIEIVVMGIENGRVKLGISAPRDMEIVRKEIYDEVENINKSSALEKDNLDRIKDLFKDI